MTAPTPTFVQAPAKLNLILSVAVPEPIGAEKAGFHRIASWFAAVSVRDDVEISPADGGSTFEVAWAADAPRPTPIDWPADKDLAFRAHRLIEQEVGRALPARLRIRKRIPVGGGLGGGSSDAAAVMIGLDRVFGLNLGVERLRALAMQLGSDVGYFVSAGQSGPPPAVVTGFGEAVRSVPHAPARVLLVIPPFGCPTGPVYQAYDRLLAQRAQTEPTRRAAIANEDLSEKRRRKVLHAIGRGEGFPSELLFNDLTHAAFAVEPRLGRMVTALANTLRTPIHMTGSGSCLFAIPPAPKAERMLQHARSLLTDVEPGSAALLADLLAGGNA